MKTHLFLIGCILAFEGLAIASAQADLSGKSSLEYREWIGTIEATLPSDVTPLLFTRNEAQYFFVGIDKEDRIWRSNWAAVDTLGGGGSYLEQVFDAAGKFMDVKVERRGILSSRKVFLQLTGQHQGNWTVGYSLYSLPKEVLSQQVLIQEKREFNFPDQKIMFSRLTHFWLQPSSKRLTGYSSTEQPDIAIGGLGDKDLVHPPIWRQLIVPQRV